MVRKLGVSKRVRQGDLVCALGSAWGYRNSLTRVISHVDSIDFEVDMESYGRRFFQTDCALNLGNSGGPIVNMNGEVIGVVTAAASGSYQGVGVQGIGYVIPIDRVCKVLKLR